LGAVTRRKKKARWINMVKNPCCRTGLNCEGGQTHQGQNLLPPMSVDRTKDPGREETAGRRKSTKRRGQFKANEGKKKKKEGEKKEGKGEGGNNQ